MASHLDRFRLEISLCAIWIHLYITLATASSSSTGRISHGATCETGLSASDSAAGCPCDREGERCADPYTYCMKNLCTHADAYATTTTTSPFTTSGSGPTDCSFTITTTSPVVNLDCSIQPYEGTAVHLQSTCGQQPFRSCVFNVYDVNGTDPRDAYDGPGNIYEAGIFGTCPFLGTVESTQNCSQNTANNLNRRFENVLTSAYIGVDELTSEILLKPQILLFNPPLTSPFYFVPSPDTPGGIINQTIGIFCIDANGKGNDNNLQITVVFPYCP